MAALPRILQKVFGRTGDTAQFGQIGSDSAGNPSLTKNLDAIQALGQFEAGLFSITNDLNTPPRGEDFNSLFYLITSQLKYLFQSGVPEWVSSEPYYANKSFAVGSDGNLYRSLTGSDVSPNTGNNPVGDATNWVQILDANDLLARLKTVDGSGSGLDSDLLDGQHGSYYAKVNTATSPNATDLPVGAYVLATGSSTSDILNSNSAVPVRWSTTDYTLTDSTPERQLSGTWRTCGHIVTDTSFGGTEHRYLVRRVA